MDNPVDTVTKMPPQRLLLIVAGGIGAGLLWRKFGRKTSAAPSGSAMGTDQAYQDYLNTGFPTVGGAAPGTPIINAPTGDDEPTDEETRRDLAGTGYFPLPILQYVLGGKDGTKYIADDTGAISPLTSAPTTPAPTTPAPSQWSPPSYLSGVRFVQAEGSPAIYSVTPQGLEWVPNWSTYLRIGGFKSDAEALKGFQALPPSVMANIPRVGTLPPPGTDSSLRT